MSSALMDDARWEPVEGFDLDDVTYHRAVDGGTVRVAFDRPAVRNAFRPGTVDELHAALDHARQLSDVGCVLLTGNGPSPEDGGWAFSSGGDQTVWGGSGYEYPDDETATAARFDDGRFRTRDRGYRDEAGRLWVLGRLDDAITTGGVTVQPDAVESAIRAHADVDDVAVVGLEDAEWGEIVAALVSTSSESALETDALRARWRERLEPAAVPKFVELTDALPRTASGTVDRTAVRDRLREARRRGGL